MIHRIPALPYGLLSAADLCPPLVDPRYPFSETADEFIIESSAQLSQIFHCDTVITVFSHESNLIHELCLRNICHIDHELIHADPA